MTQLNPKKDRLVKKFEVELDDVFNLKNLYKALYQYYVDEAYVSADGGEPENLYFEIINDQGAVNHWIWWRYVSRYHRLFQVFCKIDFRGIMTTKAEVMFNDQKKKTNKSDLTLMFEYWVQWDPDDIIGGHWLLHRFEGFIRRKFFGKVEQWIEDEAKGDGDNVRAFVKRYWGFKDTQDYQKHILFENRGLGDIRK